MTRLGKLRKKTKELGIIGCSTMKKAALELALVDKHKVSVGTQADFAVCYDCGLQAVFTQLSFKAAEKRKVVYDDEVEIDAGTGEVLGCEIDYGRKYLGGSS